MNTEDLDYLLANYFPQDLYEIFGDERAAVNAFISEAPVRAARVPEQVHQVIDSMSESDVEQFVLATGCEYIPPPDETYTGWLRDVARRVREAQGG